MNLRPVANREWWVVGLVVIVVLGLLVAAAFVLPAPFGKADFTNLQHNPFRLEHPVPVKIELRPRPERLAVRYVLGWQQRRNGKRKVLYLKDVEGVAEGLTPLTLRVLDKGYSYIWFEFRRGDNVFTKTYSAMPALVEPDFRHRMHYPRLQLQPADGGAAAPGP